MKNRIVFPLLTLFVVLLVISVGVGVSIRIDAKNKLEVYDELVSTILFDPDPSWIKKIQVDSDRPPIIRMIMINKAYEDVYGITNEQYKNKQDFEVWGEEKGKLFYAFDLEVISSNKAECEIRASDQDEEKYVRRVCKWLIPFKDGFLLAGRASRME
jgi:hypothetical protein